VSHRYTCRLDDDDDDDDDVGDSVELCLRCETLVERYRMVADAL
jgi:hypothetical protein